MTSPEAGVGLASAGAVACRTEDEKMSRCLVLVERGHLAALTECAREHEDH